jgi:hypothetical protein
MVVSRALRVLALTLCAAPLLIGCASVSYRTEPLVSHSRFTTIENFSTDAITPEQVDGLLAEVAQILNVRLDPTKPKARIIVTTPSRIAELYRATTVVVAHGADAEGLYFSGASLVMVSYFDRTILGHELAHYLTDHYLKQIPRDDWERVAAMVERKLPSTPVAVATTATVVAANGAAPAIAE